MKKYWIGLIVLICLVLAVAAIHRHGHKTVAVKPAPVGSYVALGDSVSAGVGLETDSDSSACDRTNEAYPDLVAAKLNYSLKNLGCTMATLPAGILGDQNVNNLLVSPQISQLFAAPKPALVTITIGANDSDWTGIIGKCYSGECGSSADTAEVNSKLATMTSNLSSALSQIGTHYGTSKPKVVVTGYHQVFPATLPASCNDLTGIDASELSWARQQQTALSDTIKAVVANFSFAAYAPIDFTGHELCATTSWVQDIGSSQPYHPTDAGQQAYATAVEAALKTLN